jgi:AraC family L-rhamnose operon regulatory protein RhaS
MERYRQFEPILISDFEVCEWQHPTHNHNHYEFIYIKHGAGIHTINQLTINYERGDVFLIGPEDDHNFEIKETTRLIYLKFTDLYIHQKDKGVHIGIQNLEYLLKSKETHAFGFILSSEDRSTIEMMFNVVISLKDNVLRNEQLIWMQLLALAVVLQRNMPELKTAPHRSKDMQAVFCYLHKFIYEPDKLRAQVMAANFNLTESYIGPYFKRNAGITLRNYISNYRKTLIHQRLASGRYSLKEIAFEFGLTDESHVLKLIQSKE